MGSPQQPSSFELRLCLRPSFSRTTRLSFLQVKVSPPIAVVCRVEPLEPVDDFCLKPKPSYAIGSLGWEEEQRLASDEVKLMTKAHATMRTRPSASPSCLVGPKSQPSKPFKNEP